MDDKPIDPLHRIFKPREKRNTDGTIVFETSDHTKYRRASDGSIRRIHPKVNGKDARKLRRQHRGVRG